MRLLLDTHVLIWALGFSRVLPTQIRALLADSRNEVIVSAASILEIATKNSSGRRRAMPVSAEQACQLADQAGYRLLQVSAAHAIFVETIASFHADPIDRLILAQAQAEGLRLVTHDEALASYDSRTILF